MIESLDEFNHDKSRKKAKLQAQIDSIENGTMAESLKLELQLVDSLTFEKTTQERRFLVN